MLIKLNKGGLFVSFLYILMSSFFLIEAFMNRHDYKSVVIFVQIALLPSMLFAMLLKYSHFLSHNMFFTNPGLFYVAAIVMCYGLGCVFEIGYVNPPRWAGFAILGAFLTIIIAPLAVDFFEKYSEARRLAQNHFDSLYFASFPQSFEMQKRESEQILWSYPHDPRARYAHAALMYDTGRTTIAESDLLMILTDKPAMKAFPSLEPYVRALLVDIEANEGKLADAKATAAPICTTSIAEVRSRIDPLAVCP